MYTIVYITLSTIGYLGAGYGMYKLFIEKEKLISYHILAYVFFIFALTSVMVNDHFGIFLFEVIAILYFIKYVKMKGAK